VWRHRELFLTELSTGAPPDALCLGGQGLGPVAGVADRDAPRSLSLLHPPSPSPAASVASLNTHDTATFAGWWRGADIDDRRDLGLTTDAQDAQERVARDRARAALLAFTKPEISDGVLTDVERAMVAVTADLAAGPAEVMLVALDDLALDPVPHNVPGTTVQRPNWQRRVEGWSDALDEDRASPAAAAAIAAVVAVRPSPR